MAGEPIFTSALTASAVETTGFILDMNAVGDGTGSVEGDGNGITYSLLGDDVLDERFFYFDYFTGELSFRQAPDFETPLDENGDGVYEVYVRATDEQNGQSTIELVQITVTDRPNDPIFTSPSAVTVDENTRDMLDVQSTSYLGPGNGAVEGDGLAYQIIEAGGEDGYLFSIDEDTGVLSFGVPEYDESIEDFVFTTPPPDFENPRDSNGDNIYEVTVAVRDYNSPDVVSYQNLLITIANVVDEPNQPPTAVEVVEAASQIEENTDTTGGFKIGNIVVTDDGQGVNTLSLQGADAALFEIRGSELYFIGAAPDYETISNYSVTIEVIDFDIAEIPTAHTDLNLDVIDIDEAPTGIDVADPIASIDENTTAATRIADVFAIDEDLDEFFRDNIVTVDDTRFEIAGSELRLKAGQVIDFETEPSITLTLSASANVAVPGLAAFGLPAASAPPVTRTITLAVNDLNEAATAIAAANAIASIDENTAASTKIADVIVTDPDTAAAFRVNPVSVDDARFEVVNGELLLKAGQAIDFETEASISLVLSTAAGLSTGLTLAVSDVNEAPVAVNDTGAAGENETKSFNLVGNDTDADNTAAQLTLASFTVTSVSGIALSNAQAQAALSISGNQLQFNPGAAFDPLNAGQQAVVTVSYVARDPGNLTSTGTFQLTVSGAAEPGGGNVITGTNGGNFHFGTNGADIILGLGGNDFLSGAGGDDTLDGGAGGDFLWGGNGNDVLMGGAGIDFLVGGLGADTFKFGPGDSSGGNRFGSGDYIADFSRAQGDKIDLSAIDANSGVAGDQAFSSLVARSLAQGVSAPAGTIVAQGGSNVWLTTVFLHTNGDGVADFTFSLDLRSTAANALQLGDFIL